MVQDGHICDYLISLSDWGVELVTMDWASGEGIFHLDGSVVDRVSRAVQGILQTLVFLEKV